MAKLQQLIGGVNTNMWIGAGTNYVVKTNAGVYYVIYIDNSLGDVFFRKSTDRGVTFGSATNIAAISTTNLSVWYDRWSGVAGDLIHIAYTDSGLDDTYYRSIDTASADTLSSQTTIFAGASTANGGALSIVRARGGNLYCKTTIDAGVEGGFFRSTDVGANWTSRTDSEALATTDQWILMPGWGADNQDIMMFFWDASAEEISRCLYDDSGDSWSESSIATSMNDVLTTDGQYPFFAATVDITNSRNLLVAWTDRDLVNADLRCWHITESAITEVTNVVLNSVDDQGLCAIGIDTATEDWYVFYGGASDGSEAFNTILNLYYKKSTDDGATWGSETKFSPDTGSLSLNGLWCSPRFNTNSAVMSALSDKYLVLSIDAPAGVSPTYAIGI